MSAMEQFDLQVREYKRGLVRGLLIQCTAEQQIFFDRMYKGIEHIKEEQMRNAYDQCSRTLAKNEKQGVMKSKV